MRLTFGFPRYDKVVVYTPPDITLPPSKRETSLKVPDHLLQEIEKDSLSPLDDNIKPELWRYRWSLRDRPRALSKLLQVTYLWHI